MSEPVTAELVEEPNSVRSLQDTYDYGTAEAYYLAARKRLGLLDYTISAAQCFFLTGVYEMYTLRPLKAWGSFSRACEVLQIYFRGQNGQAFYSSEGIVSRLYWSCLKSEWWDSSPAFHDLMILDLTMRQRDSDGDQSSSLGHRQGCVPVRRLSLATE